MALLHKIKTLNNLDFQDDNWMPLTCTQDQLNSIHFKDNSLNDFVFDLI